MSNIPISSLPLATALDGSELVPVVQGGTTKRTTTAGIAALASTGTGGTSPFILVTASPALPNSRGLAVESSVLSLTDGGAQANVTVGVAANGITNAKLAQMAAGTVKANVTNALANAADVPIAQILELAFTPNVVSAVGEYDVTTTDLFVVINKTDGADVKLPTISSKQGPVTIVAAQGSAHGFNVTLTNGTIMGALTTYPFNGDYQAATFYPIPSLTTWAVA